MKNRLIGLTLCLLALIAFIGFHTMLNVKSENKDTAYYILASNMFDKRGEFIEIDTDGKLVNKRSLKMQDVTKFNFNQNGFIAGGERANNNLILHGDGEYKIFSLLDNPNYSGVTSINLCDEKIIAVMNGNVEGDTYKNLLLVQNEEGNILKKEIIDLYSSDLLCEENELYIVGSHLFVEEDIWSSKIIKVDLYNDKIEEKIYEKDMEYEKVILFENQLYCLGRSTKGRKSTIDIVDKKSLEKLGSFSFQQDISAIFTMNNHLYCIADNEICELKDGVLSDSEYTLPEGTFVSSYLSDNIGVYIYCRNENIVKENQKNHMGYIIKYDKQSTGMVKETPVLIGKRYDHILFFPREYIDL